MADARIERVVELSAELTRLRSEIATLRGREETLLRDIGAMIQGADSEQPSPHAALEGREPGSIAGRIRVWFAALPAGRIVEPPEVAAAVGVDESQIGTIRSTLSRLADDESSNVEKIGRGQYRRRALPSALEPLAEIPDLPDVAVPGLTVVNGRVGGVAAAKP